MVRLPSLAAAPASLHPKAASEISAVLNEKASWTPNQCKMESHLIHALKKKRGEPFAAGAPSLELDVKLRPDGRVLVDVNATVTPALLDLINRGGGEVINSFPQFHAIRALLRLDQLETLAAAPEVMTIRRADQGRTNTGSVDSEGDTTHRAITARSAFGVSGTGVKVGVLSDGVQYLTNSQASGELGAVTILSGQNGSADDAEGTAMLEIIHDLAPGAQLFYATGTGGQANFAQNILNLRSAGCDIIVDDYFYSAESPFQDGLIARAVNSVTAGGALYFSAAGNSGNFDSGTSGTWEGDFVDGGPAGAPLPESGRLHQFGALTYNTVAPGGGAAQWVDLFWADPLGGATNDYDLFVLDSTGTTVLRNSINRQTGTQDPFEFISYINSGERIVIVKYSGSARFLHLDTNQGRLSVHTPGATHGHSATTNAFSVAEVDSATAYPLAFTGGSANPVETESADGPRHVFFHANGAPITPGNFSATGGAFRQKPDLAAADGVSTSVPGFETFYGTSAAAPHAAAIAALLKSYNPGLSPAQIRAILTSTALDIMVPGPDRDAGAGIVMADAALQAAPPDPLLILPGTGFSARGRAGGPFSATNQVFVITNNGTALFFWSVTTTSAWLNVSPTSGLLVPASAALVTVSLNSGASNLLAGSDYAASVSFSNLTSGLGQRRQFRVSVLPPPPAEAYPNLVLSLNPLAYWQLNETNPAPNSLATNAGTLGPIAHGVCYADVGKGQPGQVGNCFRFSNPTLDIFYLGSTVDVPYHPALNPDGPFSVEFWAKPAQLTTDVFCPAGSVDATQNGGSSRFGWIFYQQDDNTWQFGLGGFDGYVATISGGMVQSNVWQHLAGVYDGTTISLYVNGEKVAGPTPAGGFSPNRRAPLRLGATTLPSRAYDGWVDEAAFYGTALSASDVAAHYAAATTNNPGYAAQLLASQPLGYWRLEGPAVGPAASTSPVAVNIGSLAPIGNGLYQPGSMPGVPGPQSGFGASNRACQFSAFFEGYIRVPAAYLNPAGPLTLLAWAKANPATDFVQPILSKGSYSYRLTMDETGHPHFANGTEPSSDLIGPNRIDDGQWHQLAGVYDGVSSEFLYLDGELAASTTAATGPVFGNGDELWIGGDPETSSVFDGIVDEVAVFTNRLTTTQIQQLYSAASVPPFITGAAVTGPPGSAKISFSWKAITGRRYQIQSESNLNQTAWSNLSTLTATNSIAAASDPLNSNARRFYRVILLP